MRATRWTSLPAVVVIVLLGASACGTSDGPEPISDPRPSTTSTSQPTADPERDDEIVWQEFTRGGFVPTEVGLGQVPDVTIYADGRIIVSERATDLGDGRPIGLQVAQIPTGALDDFLAAADDSGLFGPGADFGDPMVTDQASTSVTLRSGDVPETIDVYALDFDLDPEIGGVSADQAQRRDELKALLEQARDLATDPEPYVPDRVRATLFTLNADIGGSPDAAGWPGPPLSAFPEPSAYGEATSCLIIEGPDAAEVSAAAADNPDGRWTIDGKEHQIVVAPLVPGQEGCPPS